MDCTTILTVLATFIAAVQAGGPQKYSFNLMVGTGSGRPFKIEGMGRISGIRTWDHGNYVYGLQLRYDSIWSAMAGSAWGNMQEFELYDDEAIIQISGKYARNIQYLHFGTSKGRFFIAGQPSGQCFNFVPEFYGAELRFISGTANGGLTGFSTHWGLVTEADKNVKGF